MTIYSITETLSKALQVEVILAVESQKTANLALETLERMRSQENSNAFFDTVKSKVEKIDFIEEPSLHQKKQILNYRTLEQYFDVQGLTSKSVLYHPSDACENFQLIYFEVLDPITSVIKERFNHDFLHENYHDGKQKKMFRMQFFVIQNQLVLEKPSKHSRAVKN